jgi:O-antigen/teichoic acid export membrane protein
VVTGFPDMVKKLLNYQFRFRGHAASFSNIIANPLFAGSAVMVFGTNLANFFAYIYHVIIGRLFGPESYGELAATISLIGMIAAAVTFFSMVIIKFVSAANKEEQEKLFGWFLSRALIIGAVICVIAFLLTNPISSFMHVDRKIIVLIGPILLVTIVSLVFKAFLQGILKFKENVIVTNIEMVGRLLFALTFIYLGFEVFGAILGLLISGLVGVILGRLYLKNLQFTGFFDKSLDMGRVVSYSAPILLASVAVNSILSADVILAKHFFDAKDAGIYASIATIGRIIFFGTSPISSVMFPMVSQKQSKGEPYLKIFLTSLGMTLVAGGAALLLFLVLPGLVVGSLYGNKFADASGNIFWYGLFMLLFSLANVILNYYLSIGKTKLVFISVVAAILQIMGIWIFHSSIFMMIQVSIVVTLLLFLSLFVYFLYETRKTSTK